MGRMKDKVAGKATGNLGEVMGKRLKGGRRRRR